MFWVATEERKQQGRLQSKQSDGLVCFLSASGCDQRGQSWARERLRHSPSHQRWAELVQLLCCAAHGFIPPEALQLMLPFRCQSAAPTPKSPWSVPSDTRCKLILTTTTRPWQRELGPSRGAGASRLGFDLEKITTHKGVEFRGAGLSQVLSCSHPPGDELQQATLPWRRGAAQAPFPLEQHAALLLCSPMGSRGARLAAGHHLGTVPLWQGTFISDFTGDLLPGFPGAGIHPHREALLHRLPSFITEHKLSIRSWSLLGLVWSHVEVGEGTGKC